MLTEPCPPIGNKVPKEHGGVAEQSVAAVRNRAGGQESPRLTGRTQLCPWVPVPGTKKGIRRKVEVKQKPATRAALILPNLRVGGGADSKEVLVRHGVASRDPVAPDL